MPSSHRGLTTAMHSYTARLWLTLRVCNEYTIRLPDWFCVVHVATVPGPCYKNVTGCPWHAESISRYWYLHTKSCTTKRQCTCVNSCAHINRQEHCALPAVTVWKWSALVPRLGAARSQWLRRLCGTLYLTLLKPMTLSPASNVD